MALQRISQPFRGFNNANSVQNTIDLGPLTGPSGVPAYTSMWTLGTTLVDQPSFQIVSQHWRLLSVAFRAVLYWGGGWMPMYGKFGKVYAAVDPSGALQSTNPYKGYVGSIPPWKPLPSDPTLVSTLWDPNVDSLPPNALQLAITPQGRGQEANTIVQLPVPIEVFGLPVSVGLWVEQSLFGSPKAMPQSTAFQGIQLHYATYTLNFDDGS